MTTNDTLRGNIEAALRLLLKSEKDYLRRAAEVGIEDLGILVARLDEKLSVESADAWLAHRFNEVYDEKKSLEEQLEAAQAELTEWRTSIATERLTEQLEAAHDRSLENWHRAEVMRDALERIAEGSDYTWGNIARLALEGIEVDPNEPSDGRDLRGGVLP